MLKIPHIIPGTEKFKPGQSTTPVVDTGGYDVMIGGLGFRLASSQQMPYTRVSDKMATTRIDQAPEPGEATLSPLPWIKSQSSFHGGAGQPNIESLLTTEDIEHIRYDTSLNCDVWTPGEVRRLPDVTITALATGVTQMVTAAASGVDIAIVGGPGTLAMISWPSGPDAVAATASVTLSGATFGGASNVTVESLTTDGLNYYALLTLTTANGAGQKSLVVTGVVGTTTAPTVMYYSTTAQVGTLEWVKQRLVGGLNNKLFELDPVVSSTDLSTLTANYSHPITAWTWQSISESPSSILAAGWMADSQSSVIKLELTTDGDTPVLTGGAVITTMPGGEAICDMASYLGSFLAIATTRGLRVGTFDTYTGAMKYGPLTLTTPMPVRQTAGRDRFIFAGYTDAQADGKTGLARVDLGTVVDQPGRNAWAPDLHPPTSAPTGMGEVTAVAVLSLSQRLVFVAPDGLHIEGSGPGTDGVAFLQTSKIRYGTGEPKLFTLGKVRGDFSSASVKITALTPYGGSANCGTYGFTTEDPGEFGLVPDPWEWIQIRMDLMGSSCELSSYQVKAIPQERRQRIITQTYNCFQNEQDKFGLDVTDPVQPRDRLLALEALEQNGGSTDLVEFTQTGSVTTQVVVEMVEYSGFDRPSIDDDFGGYITTQMRTTET